MSVPRQIPHGHSSLPTSRIGLDEESRLPAVVLSGRCVPLCLQYPLAIHESRSFATSTRIVRPHSLHIYMFIRLSYSRNILIL